MRSPLQSQHGATLIEILVAVLQAYVFTVLTAVYIQLAVAEEH